MRARLLSAVTPLAAIVAAAAGCTGQTVATSAPTPPPAIAAAADAGAGDDWTAVGGTDDEAHYSRLDAISSGNVGTLGLAWALDLPGEVTLEATPLEVGGTIFFSGSYAAVYAVDASSGKLLWKYDPQTWKHSPMKMFFSFGANRGVAYEDGRVFVAALDGRLIALDAKTGRELWVANSIPEGALNISTGAPRVMNGKVIIGNGGADFGARGFVTAFDAATGRQLWRFFTVPGKPEDNRGDAAMEAAEKTWRGEWWKTGTGGTVWNGMTFDAEKNRVYIGVGNAGPYDPEARSPGGGDNLYTTSIVALDATTGRYLWHYQQNPRDAWDYKATPNITLATIPVDGAPRKVLLHAPTNGFFYVIDRDTGKLLNQPGMTTPISWATGIDMATGRPIERPNIRYETGKTEIWPGTVGGHNWQPMSFSPKTGLVYIPIQQIGASFTRSNSQSDGAFNVMGLRTEAIVKKPGDGHGFLVAWDPVTQKQAWRVEHPTLWNGGTLATAGNLVFQGTADGWFNAYDATTGARVWRFDAGLGIIGAPIAFSHGGRQYISILVGYGGTSSAFGKFMDVGWKYGKQPRRLLTFALGGTATLPASPPPDFTVHALDDPAYKIVEADVDAGRALSVRCAACHGVGFHATGTPGPDLRESAIALDLESFSTLLKTGALIENGMPAFPMLSDTEIRQLHAYIRARAREALGLRKPGPGGEPMPKL